jgi:hypothetical protein
MPVSPENELVDWYSTFTSKTFVITTGTSVDSTSTGGTVETTETNPIDSSLTIISVEPENKFPPEPTVLIEITSATSFSISGIYINVMLTSHTWRDKDFNIQTSIIAPESGTYDKIIQIDSPPRQIKPWKYVVTTSNDQTSTITTSTLVLSTSTVTQNTTATSGTVILVGTTSSSITLTQPAPPFTKITTVTTVVTTTTNWIPPYIEKNSVTNITTATLTITTGSSVVNTSTTSTFIMNVRHDNYNVIRDKILEPLISGQPPDNWREN